jgi:membrane-associated phospholipid phosphatase
LLFTISGTVAADVVLDWNNTALGAIKTSLFTSVKVSRTLAMVHVAMYDAVNSIEQTHEPFYVWLSAPDGDISTDAAAAMAAYGVLAGLFPEQIATLDAALADSLAAIPDGDAKAMGMQLGELVASGVLLIREKDGSDAMVPYTPGTEPGDWRPTPPNYLPAMMPHWADVTPFAMEDGAQFRKTSPPRLSSRSYANAVNQVKAIGAKNSSVRTMEQTMIANFWADMPGTETTVGRWNLVAQDVAVAHGNTLSENARLFALLNVALADAGISAWDFKFHFNLWRPVTAIREADTDGNKFTDPDPAWEPLLMTPAFPEYVSAHSTFSAAAAQMLASYFGRNNVTFTIDPFMMMGMSMEPRTYTSFSDAALEAGASRIYGGIHYLFSNVDGLNAGRSISNYVWQNFMRPVR